MKKSLTLGLLAAFLLSLTGIAFAAETIKVGALFALTGAGSYIGTPQKNSAQMAVDEINAKGGVNGQKLELIVMNTASNSGMAVMFIGRLIQTGEVIAIIGPSTSGETLAVTATANMAQIPLISCASSDKSVNPVAKYVFKTAPSDADAVKAICQELKNKGFKKIAILTSADAYGQEGRELLEKLAPDYGITIVAQETYGPKDTDMTAQLTKIKGANPDAVVNWSDGATQSVVCKHMRMFGMKQPLFQSPAFGSAQYLKIAGGAAEGVSFPAGKLLIADSQYTKDYSAKFNEPASVFGGYAYDAVNLLANAITQAKSTDSAGICKALEDTKRFTGVTGTYNLSSEDHCGLTQDALVMVTVKGGKFVPAQK